jgi:hypothetical protein
MASLLEVVGAAVGHVLGKSKHAVVVRLAHGVLTGHGNLGAHIGILVMAK